MMEDLFHAENRQPSLQRADGTSCLFIWNVYAIHHAASKNLAADGAVDERA
ncbi:hypothetical protein FY134_15965 [Agrobacterium fabrum]|jgi:hypothetical protein|uniref:hypothetical protein n=1 Tax=Agrobacterium fabrum TaxID=1176649 RepID=UPI0013A6B1C5|nr:hypothetical protein [Agrobacterium fabrum]MDH6295234.1 hypothetical protein [Agrobacterium fabrum]UXT59213.1 hypothetical protein FY134_15965 [Agrobacterium fabrum]